MRSYSKNQSSGKQEDEEERGMFQSLKDFWSRKGVVLKFLWFFCSALILLLIPFFFIDPSSRFIRLAPDCLQKTDDKHQQRVDALVKRWESFYFGNASGFDHPAAPHIQNCKKASSISAASDRRSQSGAPEWTRSKTSSQFSGAGEETQASQNSTQGPHPPWVRGGDEDNLPMTRQVQTDLWLHQHPKNCYDKSLKFLVNDWMNTPKLGLGAQIVSMTGILAMALNEKRILVTLNFNRADHEECKGPDRSRWSCYFAPETSQECIDRAMRLVSQKSAWAKGTVASVRSFPKDAMWFGKVPEYWGTPWENMETFDVINGEVLGKHNAADRHWWRAQAMRYFTRFPSSYTCSLMNKARHQAFGRRAAEMVLRTEDDPQNFSEEMPSGLSELWNDQAPWRPSPLVSIHVRQGDKAKEMKLFEFSSYMKLARQIRTRFPHLKDVWLSSEMENVIEESKSYTSWRFFYTDVPRQNGTTSMGEYEKSLGVITSSNNAFVNLLMAADCDYFVGALGSTWSFIIDGLRLTTGKLQNSFLSVNKDRYW